MSSMNQKEGDLIHGSHTETRPSEQGSTWTPAVPVAEQDGDMVKTLPWIFKLPKRVIHYFCPHHIGQGKTYDFT